MGLNKLVENQTFTYRVTKENKILIYYQGKQIMIVSGTRARKLKVDLQCADEQQEQYLLARITGNFKHGNERKK